MNKYKISLPVTKNQTSKEAPPCVRMKGSYMVELAVVLPFFTGFMVVLLFFFQVLMVQQEVGNALLTTGRELSVLAAGKGSSKVNVATAKIYVCKNIKANSHTNVYVRGKEAGISLAQSDFSGDYITLRADYRMRLPIGLFGKREIMVTQKLKCRKWTGSSNNQGTGEGDCIVYITPTGSVYHKKRECSAIKLTIASVNWQQVSHLRNKNGGKYYACGKCMKNTNLRNMMVYVTEYGSQYHGRRDCSRIKRTVYAVRLSEVKGRAACGKCGRKSL